MAPRATGRVTMTAGNMTFVESADVRKNLSRRCSGIVKWVIILGRVRHLFWLGGLSQESQCS